MSKKFEICSATYNIALNQDEDDVFRTVCAHLYNFLHGSGNHGRSPERKPMTLKIHLELNELIEETERQTVEPSNSNNPERPLIQQLEAKFQSLEDSLQANIVDAVNKVTERIEKKLEKNLSNIIDNKLADVGNKTIDHETNNVLLNSSDNAPKQSAQQLEAKLKTLEDALQASNADAVNKLMKRFEKLENNIPKNILDKTPGVGNNTINHDSNNVLLSSCDNFPRQSDKQLEEKLKALEEALQANNADAVNKLMERMEKLENNISKNIIDKTPGVGNNTIDHDSNNVLLNLSDNSPIQSTLQLEAKLKTLEDALQASNADAVNKLMERMEKLENNISKNIVDKTPGVGNNTIDHESNNDLLSSSDNFPRQSNKQLEEKSKTLEDALQANSDVINKTMEFLEKKFEKNLSNNFVNKATDVGNNSIDHESNNALLKSSEKSVKQSVQQHGKEINALKDCIEKLVNNKADNETADIGNPTTPDNSTEKRQQQANSSQKPSNNGNNGSDDHSDGKEYKTTPKEKKEIKFDRNNLLQIWGLKSSDSSLETAIHNVIQYAKEMKLLLTRDHIKHIDVRTYGLNELAYYVFFRTKTIKEAFLMKSDILRRSPHNLEIYNESEYNTVFIRNFKSSDLSEDRAIVNVIGLAKQMGLTLLRNQFKIFEVFTVNQSCLVCRVFFFYTQVKDEFLKKSHILKGIPETKSVDIF